MAMVEQPRSGTIVLATLGSLGDLHPLLAIGIELKRRGHRVKMVTTEFYRDRVSAAGLEFRSMRPNWNPTDPALIASCEELKRGPEILFRRIILPHLRATYEDLYSATADADLTVAGELVYAAPLVAEKRHLPWVSAILSPCSFFSAHDPSVLVNAPQLIHLRMLGWRVYRSALNVARVATRHWWNPVRELRRQIGLSPSCDPVFRDKFSPDRVLALFSREFALPQPDWPRQTRQPGFVFLGDTALPQSADPRVTAFLANGDAPLVFTQGSTAVHHAGRFFEISAAIAQQMGRRAVLVGAHSEGASSDESDGGNCLRIAYAPYELVFPSASVIVHQGGSGTIGQALRAGKPQMVVPFGWDQPDNGSRVERVGVGFTVPRKAYSVERAMPLLRRLLEEPEFSENAQRICTQMERERGVHGACDAIEEVLFRSADGKGEPSVRAWLMGGPKVEDWVMERELDTGRAVEC